MYANFALIKGSFKALDQIRFSFFESQAFNHHLTFAIPVVKCKAFALQETMEFAQSFAAHMGINAVLQHSQIAESINHLQSQNKLYSDCKAELLLHPQSDKNNSNLSILLRPVNGLSTQQEGTYFTVKQNLFSNINQTAFTPGLDKIFRPTQADKRKNKVCYSYSDGYIRHTNTGSLLLIKKDICYYPKNNNRHIYAPVLEKVLLAIQNTGMQTLAMNIQQNDLLDADEVLFTSNETVLEWAKGYEQRRYFSRKFRKIKNEILSHLE